jgi:hypothetical protein
MDEEDKSVIFLQEQMNGGFSGLMERYIIKDLEWLEFGSGAHAVATLADPASEGMRCNITCLFPPFYPNNE